MNNKLKFFLIIFFLFGFVLRVFLAANTLDAIVWDMNAYHQIALDFLSGKFAADCCQKNAGYGMFLAILYSFFGSQNLWAVRVVQIIIDLGVGIILYFIAKRIFDREVGVISYILYVMNPLTSSYVGLRLPESVTLFILTLIIFILSFPTFLVKKRLWFVWGVLLGILLLTRLQFFNLILLSIVLFGILYFRNRQVLAYFGITVLGFMLISSYSLIVNYINYHKISFTTPYGGSYYQLYTNFYNDRPYPELIVNMGHLNQTFSDVTLEYWATPLSGKVAFEEKYQKLFWKKIQKDWPVFMKNSLNNIYWLWNKDHLSAYVDPWYPRDAMLIQIYNAFLIVCALLGLVFYILKKRFQILHQPSIVFALLLFLFFTFAVPIVSNESRHTICLYALVILWAGYTLRLLVKQKKT